MLAKTILRLSLEHGLIPSEPFGDLESALSASRAPDAQSMLDQLYASGTLCPSDVLMLLGEHFHIPVQSAYLPDPSEEALGLFSPEVIHSLGILPLAVEGSCLHLAIADPLCLEKVDSYSGRMGLSLQPVLVDQRVISEKIRTHLPKRAGTTRSSEQAAVSCSQRIADQPPPEDAPAVACFVQMLQAAVSLRSSDIHLEPQPSGLRVRFRIDGCLRTMKGPERSLSGALISRIKLLSGMSLAEKRLPQDGRIRQELNGRVLDLRVSCLPCLHGESIVLRILEQESICPRLDELGFLPDHLTALERLIRQPDGLFLVTGPTGAGKSTTLYSALQQLNGTDRKIITVEDPVEYLIEGINQVPVRRDVGMHFSSALRAMLRQSPNIIMVGEIRDTETAETAIHAALTGHMVFSTLHTNDATGAIIRLMRLGVKPFLLNASLRGILAQRLVRRVCPQCSVPTPNIPDKLHVLPQLSIGEKADFREGRGCPHCNQSGFYGRIGIFELLDLQDPMGARIDAGFESMAFRQWAIEGGMRTLRQDGSRKVALGLTTADEVLAATLEATS